MQSLKQELANLGLSKTVYALRYPESVRVVADTLHQTAENQNDYFFAHTGKQDTLHNVFLDKYRSWASEVVNADWDKFAYQYPTNGSSEAIREQIAYLAASGIDCLYVLDGEYEGYEAIAKGLGLRVIKINRLKALDKDYLKQSFPYQPGVFFISQPSSIDGNIWAHYDDFMVLLNEIYPSMGVYVDLAYVGCIADNYQLELQYENVEGIFFSLSKAFGVYYDRIGGVFLKNENPLLYGNKWFKNILSMKIGFNLMDAYDVYTIPKKYRFVQEHAVDDLIQDFKYIQKADVILLANLGKDLLNKETISLLSRNPQEDTVRICLTAILEGKIREPLDEK